jgi:2-polyprenyl-3-methyl-5-hydroxy-6-metoxy-1,4-benzoquinol methylase
VPLLTKWLTHRRLLKVGQHLGTRVLDVGCGNGELIDYLPAQVERIILLDSNPDRWLVVDKKLANIRPAVQFLVRDVNQEQANLPPGPFDTVVMAALLEHLKLPIHALKNVRNVLTDDGKLIMSTPTPLGGILHKLGSYLGFTCPEAAHEHEHFYDFPAIKQLMEANGFTIEFYSRFLLSLNQVWVARKKPS